MVPSILPFFLSVISVIMMSCILSTKGCSAFLITRQTSSVSSQRRVVIDTIMKQLTMSTTSTSSTSVVDQTPPTMSTSMPILDDPKIVSSKVFSNQDERPIILFDGVCNLCNTAVNLALDWDPNGKLRFAALQSNVGRSLLEANNRNSNDISSIVLVTKNGAYIKSDAVLKITEELTPFSSLLPLKPAAIVGQFIIPKFIRDLIYDGVADNRYNLMGKKDVCRFDADGEFEDRFINDTIALKD
jgi:predicted DCC family thiol-disulfide oxidoreductase YuxK